MAYEQREGGGTLFRNDKKGNDRAPDWRGDALLNGKKVKLAGWIKQGRNGEFISLTIQEENYQKPNHQKPREDDSGSSEIPF